MCVKPGKKWSKVASVDGNNESNNELRETFYNFISTNTSKATSKHMPSAYLTYISQLMNVMQNETATITIERIADFDVVFYRYFTLNTSYDLYVLKHFQVFQKLSLR